MQITFINFNSFGGGMSGGDRIWVELGKRWKNRANLRLVGSPGACEHFGYPNSFNSVGSDYCPTNPYSLQSVIWNTIRQSFIGCWWALTHLKEFKKGDMIYSVSDFYPDFLPCLIIKLLKRPKWVAGYYLFAPSPRLSNNPYRLVDPIRGWIYWFGQLISYPLVKHFADIVFITSEIDLPKFKKAVVIRGGVCIPSMIEKWYKKYDACFLGRYHLQKGVLEIIDIWEEVVKRKPEATLIMVGNGGLEFEMRKRILNKNLQGNIIIKGFLDGLPKQKILSQSRIMVHPATYDSGGMSCAEGMAYGLPAVGFDLPSHKTYYPKGMMKAQSNAEFANMICLLLEDKILYKHYSEEAIEMVNELYNWDKRANEIWSQII